PYGLPTGLPPLAGRPARRGRPSRPGVPLRPRPRRLARRRYLLRPERFPDHQPAGRRVAAPGLHQPAAVLPAPGLASDARAVRPGRRLLPGRAGPATGGLAPVPLRGAGGRLLRGELAVTAPYQPGAAGTHLVALAGRTVLPALAALALRHAPSEAFPSPRPSDRGRGNPGELHTAVRAVPIDR